MSEEQHPHARELAASASRMRSRVARQLSSTGQVVRELRAELEASRRDAYRLSQENARLQAELTMVELRRMRHANAEADWQQRAQQVRKLDDDLEGLRRANQVVTVRCRDLEVALERERELRKALHAELSCMEEELEHFRAIIAMLLDEGGEGG